MRSRSILAAVVLLALSLAPAGAAVARTIGQVIDDATIVAEIKTKLAADKLSSLTKIGVKSDAGVVTLDGTVDSAERKARAAQIAANATGVKHVYNNIEVAGDTTTTTSAPAPTGPVPGTAPVEATGTVASADPVTGTITLQDGRVLKATDQTVLWQPTTIGALRPGTQVLVRGASPSDFRPGASARDWRMGTISRVDSAGQQLVLTDGTTVRVTPATAIHRGGDRLSLAQLDPGSEVVVTAASGGSPAATGAPATVDASDISVVWTPAAASR